MGVKTLQIKQGKTRSIERFHPWIFSGAVFNEDENIQNGDLVRVTNHKGKFLAIGHFQNATIKVRVLTFKDQEIDQQFWNDRISSAFAKRKASGLTDDQQTNAYRLVHGEGDGLAGVIIDHYDGHVIIQAHSFGMYRSLPFLAKAIEQVYGDSLKSIYAKHDEGLKKKLNLDQKGDFLFGESDGKVVVKEYGHLFEVDFVNGQKTGFFLDQRENRELIAHYSKGKSVLNTFCYSGGFSVFALKAGAEHVVSLDSSEHAISLTENNVRLNGFTQEQHESVVDDATDYMKKLPKSFDVIVLDPPAFAKHRDARHKAIQAYKRINSAAIRQIKENGILFTFSCSQIIDKELFRSTILAAAIEAGRNVQVLHQMHQPQDHPINVFHPEGEYLKGLVLFVE
ncbi:MAG: class I SAM-dependent rRNA methyltransferase [Bacteroidales bacterium]|nr:class I SAM-dependent rRNA methyltransferase [Bacteroidales bacterium]